MIISPRWYHPPSSQFFYHWVDRSAGGLLVPGGIIRPVVSSSIELTTGRMIPPGTNNPPTNVSTQ
jgi:hypothetical protein